MANLTNFSVQKGYPLDKIRGNSLTIAYLPFMPSSISSKVAQGFDYASLDAPTSQFVQQQTGEIKALMKRTAQDIVEIGQKLVKVKEKLGHGNFGTWLEAEFVWSIQTAKRFMNVAAAFQNQQFVDFEFIAPSALYELAAPSTPDVVREEALARAKAGESITYKAAKSIKQKYTPPTAKAESRAASQLSPPAEVKPTVTLPPSSASKLEIVAIRPAAAKAPALTSTTTLIAPQVSQLTSREQQLPSAPSVAQNLGAFWRLGGRHLLYNGDPNSPQFLQKIPDKVSLLFAFPPTLEWYTNIRAKTRIITDEYLPQGKDVRLFEDTLESNILLYSNVGESVVSCFVPSPELLSIINRQDRYGIFAEPEGKRVKAIITDWKQAGLKVERLG